MVFVLAILGVGHHLGGPINRRPPLSYYKASPGVRGEPISGMVRLEQ